MAGEKSIGGLWVKTSKNGSKFMSGQIEIDGQKHNFVVFKNTYKEEGDNKPDYKIMAAIKKDEGYDTPSKESDGCPF